MMEARGGEGGEREENHNRRLGEKIILPSPAMQGEDDS